MRGLKRLISIPLAIILAIVGVVLMRNVGGKSDSATTTTTLAPLEVPGVDLTTYDPNNPLQRVKLDLGNGTFGYVTSQLVTPPGLADDFSIIVFDASSGGNMIGSYTKAAGFKPLG